MLTLDAASLETQARRVRKRRWEVSVRRRYWNIEAQAFVWEAAFSEIKRGDVESVGDVREALDRSDLNEFRSSNVTIELRNRLNEWSDKNPGGRFAVDSVARLGYVQQLTEFRIRAFYESEAGVEGPAVPYFTGLASEWEFSPDKGTASITLVSRHELLRRANAENVSTRHTNVLLVGVVDGVNKVFTTTQLGVGRVLEVRRTTAGVVNVSRQGIEVTVSDLDRHDLPAKVTYETAPPSGSTIRADYIEWKKDQKIEQLVKDVGVEAGVPLAEQDVEPVLFASRVLNTRLFTSQADWESGSLLQNVLTAFSPGDLLRNKSLVDDFSDGDFTNNPTWTSLSGGTVAVVSGTLNLNGVGGTGGRANVSLPTAKNTGTWRQLVKETSGTRVYLFMDSNALDGSGAPTGNGYALLFAGGGAVAETIQLLKITAGAEATLATLASSLSQTLVEWKVSRDSSGEFKVRRNAILLATVTDTAHSAANFFMVQHLNVGLGTTAVFDELIHSPTIDDVSPIGLFTSVWDSPSIDGTASFAEWLSASITANISAGASVLVETSTAAESSPGSGVPGAFDAFIEVAAGGQVRSVQRRFLKLRLTLRQSSNALLDTITVADATVLFATTTTTIKLANFKGLDGFEAIQQLGTIANYEWGFSRTTRLFFRPRSFDKTVDFIVRLRNGSQFRKVSDGVDRVFNRIVARYGTHEKLVDPVILGNSRPNSFDRFGVRTLTIGATQILVNPDADIASGLALSYFALFRLPRRRFELEVEGLPQVELSDTGLLRWADGLPNPPWHIGDSSRFIGDSRIGLFGHEQQSAFDIIARVVSVSHNAVLDRTRVELEEIL